jgi:selenocysteine-specific elongation factor
MFNHVVLCLSHLLAVVWRSLNLCHLSFFTPSCAPGVQAQTAECLVIGEITSDRLLVVLNKVDQLPEENRPKAIKKATKRLKEALASTRFATARMVAVAAKPGKGPRCDTLPAAVLVG